MRKGDHLFRRGKVWYGYVWTTRINPDTGRSEPFQEKRSTGLTDKQAASKVLAQWERDAADPTSADRRDATLADAFDLVINGVESRAKAGEASEDTVEFYERRARTLYLYAGRTVAKVEKLTKDRELPAERRNELAELGKRFPLVEAGTPGFLDAFEAHRRLEGCAASLRKERAFLKQALRKAKRDGIWTGDVDVVVPRDQSKVAPPKRKHLTWAQLQMLLGAFEGRPNRQALIAYMAMFAAEWAAVNRACEDDLTETSDLVHVRGTKNVYRDREAGIVAEWQRELLPVVLAGKDGTDGRLFSPWGSARRDLNEAVARLSTCEACKAKILAERTAVRSASAQTRGAKDRSRRSHTSKTPITPSKGCKRCAAKTFPHVSPHSMRHTYAFLMKLEGLTHTEIAPSGGWKDSRMLDATYGRPTGSQVAEMQRRSIAARKAALTLIEGGKYKAG